MSPNHHPSYELLLDYATGNLPLAPSVIVAVHCSMCQECTEILNSINMAGAALIEDLDKEKLDINSLDKVLAQLDDSIGEVKEEAIFNNSNFNFKMPKTLQNYIPTTINWKNLSSGVSTAELISNEDFNLDIYKITSGYKIPKHTHTGYEYTMVIDGGFTDNNKYFGPGDFSLLDNANEHSPKADPDKDCYCIVSLDSQIKLTGPIGRLFNFINN